MRVLSLSALLGAMACTTADILMLDTSLRPQTTPQSIRLIAQEPARPFAVVAIVSAQGDIVSARQRLIKEASGALHVHTVVGKGTTFNVYLPAVAALP